GHPHQVPANGDRLAALGRPIRCFKREGVRRWTMAGKVFKTRMFSPARLFTLLPDPRMIRFYFFRRRRDNADDTLTLGIIDEFARDGLECTSALDLCPELLVRPGVLTSRHPTTREEADIEYGWQLAKEMGRLDVGQCVAVRDRAVLAVEAIEGTDAAIRRAGELCPAGGFVVVKVAKPQQDMRFDVPTVGPSTIQSIRAAGGRVLAVEAGKTILIDEAETIRLANEAGITMISRE
ncbi:MAG TPA: UDP-2,3-diacylglucosamine diphosphatase LpxI, partial [Gemmataceae bacterium]|nr:UDP-2,3-diacylglucosamine diphosphatase LpxI [Gemmataceae bacterium]